MAKARKAHFRVVGRLDKAAGVTEGKVTVEVGAAGSAMFVVRPLRRRRTYELNLSDVADIVVYRVMMFEKKERLKAKKAARAARKKS